MGFDITIFIQFFVYNENDKKRLQLLQKLQNEEGQPLLNNMNGEYDDDGNNGEGSVYGTPRTAEVNRKFRYIYTYIHLRMYIHIYTFAHVHAHIYICACTCTYMHLLMYMHIYAFTHVHTFYCMLCVQKI